MIRTDYASDGMELERRNERNEISDIGMKLEFVGGRLRVKDAVSIKRARKPLTKKGKKTGVRGFLAPFPKVSKKGQENQWARKPPRNP